jgi:hypothetical protein
MPLTTNFVMSAGGQYTGSKAIEVFASQLAKSWTIAHANGSGAGQAAVQWSDTRMLAGGAADNLNLNGGALTDALGNLLTITKVKGIILFSYAANTTNLTIGGVANSLASIFGLATQSLTLQPGELLVKLTPSAAGYTVTPATANLLAVTNAAGASAQYDVIVIGA